MNKYALVFLLAVSACRQSTPAPESTEAPTTAPTTETAPSAAPTPAPTPAPEAAPTPAASRARARRERWWRCSADRCAHRGTRADRRARADRRGTDRRAVLLRRAAAPCTDTPPHQTWAIAPMRRSSAWEVDAGARRADAPRVRRPAVDELPSRAPMRRGSAWEVDVGSAAPMGRGSAWEVDVGSRRADAPGGVEVDVRSRRADAPGFGVGGRCGVWQRRWRSASRGCSMRLTPGN
ncbi:MAG: hypothetical protein U0326_38125 [Polyangiales bacterium]